MQLRLLTPQEEVLATQVKSVTVPGAEGELEALPGHTYLLSLITSGELRFVGESGSGSYDVGAGHVEIQDDTVTVAVDSAVKK